MNTITLTDIVTASGWDNLDCYISAMRAGELSASDTEGLNISDLEHELIMDEIRDHVVSEIACLHDIDTDEYIRMATRDEVLESAAEASGTGAINVNGRICYCA